MDPYAFFLFPSELILVFLVAGSCKQIKRAKYVIINEYLPIFLTKEEFKMDKKGCLKEPQNGLL